MRSVIVGGGIVGLTAAYEIARSGGDVVVMDAGRVGQAASLGNAAKIAIAESAPVPGPGVLLQGIKWLLKSDSPLSVRPRVAPGYIRFLLSMARHCNKADFDAGLDIHLRMGKDANALLDDYRADGMHFEMHSRGVLLAFETKDRYEEHCQLLPQFESHGHVPERLIGSTVQEREPALSDALQHGLFFSQDRQIEPDSLTSALARRIEALGGQIIENAPVTKLERQGDRFTAAVTAGGQRIEGDSLIIAAGCESREVARKVGSRLPIMSGKGYSIDYTPAPVQLRTSLTLEDARVAVTPLDGMLRLAGTMEFGSKDNRVNSVRVDAIRRAAKHAFKDWGHPSGEQEPWAGSRPMTPDGLPVVGSIGGSKNVFVSSGHSMLGLTLAAGSARIIRDMVFGRSPGMPSDLLHRISPQRF